VTGYFEGGADRVDAEWLFREDGPGQLDEALRSLGPIDDDTFVYRIEFHVVRGPDG